MPDPVVDPAMLGADGPPDSAPSFPALEIANAIARIHKHYVGRGPTNARTTIDHDLVVCLLEGGYTRAERTLEANDNLDVVAAGRHGLKDAMRDEMVAAVQDALGRRVRSFMSAGDPSGDYQVEVFVLETVEPA